MLVCLAGNSYAAQSTLPKWLTVRIQNDPPLAVWESVYKKKVFYIVEQCCDKFNNIYTMIGKKICAPDGGFSGRGDGKCPDFRKNGRIIWKHRSK